MADSKNILTTRARAYFTTPLLVLCIMVCLVGCDKEVKSSVTDPETTPTLISYNHTMVYSGNGKKRYRMTAPEIRHYELAIEPFIMYPKGLLVETFNDSLPNKVDSDLVADSVIYKETQKLWEAIGNVVGNNYAGDKKFKTEQLFWDENKGRIYSNKFTTVKDGESIYKGTNFETDQNFDRWTFNNARGQIAMEKEDSTSQKSDIADTDSLDTSGVKGVDL